MIGRWSQGFDVVYAQRRSRAGETLPKRIVAALGYRVIRRVAEVEIPPNTGDFRLMSRRVVDEVLRLNETHGFLRGLTALVGFPQASVLYDRDPRATGDGKYNRFTGSVRIGLNGIIGFSRYPLQIITWIGLITFTFAMVLALVYLGLRLAGVEIAWGNPTLVIIISFFSGIQLLSLGVIGEYVGPHLRRGQAPAAVRRGRARGLRAAAGRAGGGPGAGARALLRPERLATTDGLPPVAILAGGLGTRLGGAAGGLPKGMVPVAGRPFLEHVLERLARGGVARVVICRGHLGEAIEAGPRRRAPLRAVDRLLRRGAASRSARRAPCGGRCRCSASASWSCTATPTCALTTRRPRPATTRSGLAGPDDRAAQPGPLGHEQRRLRAAAWCAPTTSARPRRGPSGSTTACSR